MALIFQQNADRKNSKVKKFHTSISLLELLNTPSDTFLKAQLKANYKIQKNQEENQTIKKKSKEKSRNPKGPFPKQIHEEV